jgi:hypothetical protein
MKEERRGKKGEGEEWKEKGKRKMRGRRMMRGEEEEG